MKIAVRAIEIAEPTDLPVYKNVVNRSAQKCSLVLGLPDVVIGNSEHYKSSFRTSSLIREV